MTYSAFPSAPPGRTIDIDYGCPIGYRRKSDLLGTEEKKEELCQLADRIINMGTLEGVEVQAIVDGFFIDFVKGSVTISADLGQGDTVSTEIDVLSTRFIQTQKEYIASINPALAAKLENSPGRDEAEKITNIYFEIFVKYMNEQESPDHMSEQLWRSTIRSMVPGFKEKRTLDPVEAMSLTHLSDEAGKKFKSFFQTLPTSLLSSKKAMCFLQGGLDQKTSKEEKILYLKQVIFLVTFQEVFKNILESISTDLAISKRMEYTSSACNYESEHIYQDRARRIGITLAQLPANDVLMLIPLACRASFKVLSDENDANDPFRSSSSVIEERNRARKADIAFINVLKNSFGKEVKSFSVPTDHFNSDGLLTIEQFLMGISGLAISSGSSGRFPMHEHRTVYYSRCDITAIKAASDNVPVEFLMTAAQSYPETDDSWVEERCLAYLNEMVGRVSIHELDAIKAKIRKVREAIDRVPAESLIKERSPNQYILRDSAMNKLHVLCEKAKREAGLAPSSSATKSSCSIM